jgi:hypothetical protein
MIRRIALLLGVVLATALGASTVAHADMNLNAGGLDPGYSVLFPCTGSEAWNSCDMSSSTADRVLQATGGAYIRIFVPWDTFGADGGGCSWGYDGSEHTAVLNAAEAIVKTYGAVPLLVFTNSVNRAAPPSGPSAGGNMVCAISKARAAMQYVGAWSPYTALEPWNEPDADPVLGSNSYLASLYFAADYGFNPGYAAILPGVFTSGFQCWTDRCGQQSYAHDYLHSMEYHWQLHPIAWSFHDYHDPYTADGMSNSTYTCGLASFGRG